MSIRNRRPSDIDARAIFAAPPSCRRAFRRQIKADEVDLRDVALTKSALEAGRPVPQGLWRSGCRRSSVLPNFCLREEPALPLAKGDETRSTDAPRDAGAISDNAIASRISYFLWSSMPDEELLTLAAAGRLSQPEVLRTQVDHGFCAIQNRSSFVENFTGQWLHLREIDATEPDARQYPEFDEMSPVCGSRRNGGGFFREDFEPRRVASRFYRIGLGDSQRAAGKTLRHRRGDGPDVPPRSASLSGSVRGGVSLTQASVLKVTANGTNTSPVIRGVWVLDNILGQPSPPPSGRRSRH